MNLQTQLPHFPIGRRPPIVPILEAGLGFESGVLTALDSTRLDGLVLALPGGGHIAAGAVGALEAMAGRLPVVFAARTAGGGTLSSTYGYAGGEIDLISRGLIPAGPLDARKARLLLTILLSGGEKVDAIRHAFFRL